MPLQIAYLLEDTAISDVAAMALAQADALIARGHRVRIATKGLPVTWRSSRAEWIYIDDLQAFVPEDGEKIMREEVLRANPIVDDEFFRARLPRENEPLRVLLCGGSQDEERGIGDGYGAAAHARWFHQKFDLIRVSAWAPSQEEPLDDVQEFHVALNRDEMMRLMHSCDVLIAPNRRERPESLTTLEALASGLACVITATPQHLAHGDDYGQFGPPDNAVELGEKVIEVVSDPALRQRLRARAREVAEQWRSVNVVSRLEQMLTS